ncbi:hypothetical protein CR66_01915 [Campylobacter mucosalis]|uniref:CiaD-like domain-containing protein n=1 Tax=Campylobacter mucosalis TaxID=202 RepID=UPI0004D80B54|nr:hypothetical protein [Campylobacter mucosalis]KEA46612.1 hypothetical protein CR66_01915 [Campylobacter mucosalis]QKF62877.1 hypothetical protein CMCT_0736 [Campylobacter mucosalis]
MNKIDEISKITIEEITAELNAIGDMIKPQSSEPSQKFTIEESLDTTAVCKVDTDNVTSEEIFLKNLKERIEVLFEGLNEMPKERLEQRLDLTLKFLEFALANVENRLENLK